MENNDEKRDTPITELLSDIPIPLATVKIAGLHYCIPPDMLGNFRHGDPIDLHPEPTNPYDDKAVEVFWRGEGYKSTPLKVGYIPKPLAQAIFALIEAGYGIQAEVAEDCKSLITITMQR